MLLSYVMCNIEFITNRQRHLSFVKKYSHSTSFVTGEAFETNFELHWMPFGTWNREASCFRAQSIDASGLATMPMPNVLVPPLA